MQKKEIFVLSLLVIITLGLTAGAVYQAQHRQNVRDTAVVKAQKETNVARQDALASKLQLQAANSQVQTVTTQKIQLCNVLKTHKLTDPSCN